MHSSTQYLPEGIYGITDPMLLCGEKLFSGVQQALEGGCQVIQYRDKNSSFEQCLENALRLKHLCSKFDVPLVINDSLRLAIACDADGLHLGRTDDKLSDARLALGPEKIIGVTCHSDVAYAKHCIDQGASYCAFGRFFESVTKPLAPPCSLTTLKAALQLNIPIVTIGGINMDNIARFGDTPPHNIAVINSLFGQDDIYRSAQELCKEFERIQTNQSIQ